MSAPSIDEYRDRYENVSMSRDQDGVLEVRVHTDGGPLVWSAAAHRDLGDAFTRIGLDLENRIVLLTGTGDVFCDRIDHESFRDLTPLDDWMEGKRLLQGFVDIGVPVVSVVNGPAWIHAELPVLADIVVAADTASFADRAHFVNGPGAVPGDGVHVIWPRLLGMNRGRHFLLSGVEISAAEALRLGVVAEVLPSERALQRGREIAGAMAHKGTAMLRYTREALAAPLREMLHSTAFGNGLALENLDIFTRRQVRDE